MIETLALITLIILAAIVLDHLAVNASRRRTDDIRAQMMARTVHLESRALCQGWRRAP